MKALSVQQPWAWAIVFKGKDIENRSRRTWHRGPLAIHASATFQKGRKKRGIRFPERDALEFSAIVGVVEVVDCVEHSKSKWFDKDTNFGYVLKNAVRLPKPIRCRGWMGFWNLSPSQLASVRRQLRNGTKKARHMAELIRV